MWCLKPLTILKWCYLLWQFVFFTVLICLESYIMSSLTVCGCPTPREHGNNSSHSCPDSFWHIWRPVSHACPESNYLIKSQLLQSCFRDLWSFLWLCWELWGLGSACLFLADKHLIAGRRFGSWCWVVLWEHTWRTRVGSIPVQNSPGEASTTNEMGLGIWGTLWFCLLQTLIKGLPVFKLKGMCLNLGSLLQELMLYWLGVFWINGS